MVNFHTILDCLLDLLRLECPVYEHVPSKKNTNFLNKLK